eukprot:TRINITY_DN235_c3_g4_i1.p1 TRINITY_DN235_c3_g4~~TRINITY_DN235_c3_g4_i1.p1  ORF type:complete len:193 (+),score=21.11 TRINITY_DN235_c3_g4_i1:57-581(+)
MSMGSLGKCVRCNKTCYGLEGFKVGPPNKEQVYHKACFFCQNDGCTWKLTLTDYKFCDNKVYCKNHCPMTGFSNNAVHKTGTRGMGDVDQKTASNAPKLGVVNDQIRSGNETNAVGLDSMSVNRAINAPKASDNVNEQIRGAGGKATVGLDSIGVAKALDAPKATTLVNEQIRG